MYIGRGHVVFIDGIRYPPKDSKWKNPFKINKAPDYFTRKQSLEKYKEYILQKMNEQDFKELYGKNLGCWCTPEECHGNVLQEIIKH